MNFIFNTPDAPEANGRQPEDNDMKFPLTMPTDDGGSVTVVMGRAGFAILAACVLSLLRDHPDLLEDVRSIELDSDDPDE